MRCEVINFSSCLICTFVPVYIVCQRSHFLWPFHMQVWPSHFLSPPQTEHCTHTPHTYVCIFSIVFITFELSAVWTEYSLFTCLLHDTHVLFMFTRPDLTCNCYLLVFLILDHIHCMCYCSFDQVCTLCIWYIPSSFCTHGEIMQIILMHVRWTWFSAYAR